MKTGLVSANRPSVTSITSTSPSAILRHPDPGQRADRRLGPGQPGRVRRPGQPVDGPVVGRGQLGDLPGRHVDGQQPAVVRGRGDRIPVRGSSQAGHVPEKTFGQPNDAGFSGSFPRAPPAAPSTGAISSASSPVASVTQTTWPVSPSTRGSLARAAGIHVQRAGRAVLVRQPVHRTPHLDHAGLTGLVAVQRAQVILRRDQPRRPARRRGAEGDLQLPRLRRVRAVQDPDVPGHVVHDPLPVGGRVPGVPAVMIGMPGDAAAVQRAGIDVAGALVIGQEEQPPADQHRAGQLAVQVGEHPGEQGVRGRGGPQLARPAAAVPLPERGLADHAAGEQGGARVLDGHVGDGAERQQAGRRAVAGDGVGPPVLGGRLVRRGDGQHLARRGPPGDPGLRVAPVGEPGGRAAVDLGASTPRGCRPASWSRPPATRRGRTAGSSPARRRRTAARRGRPRPGRARTSSPATKVSRSPWMCGYLRYPDDIRRCPPARGAPGAPVLPGAGAAGGPWTGRSPGRPAPWAPASPAPRARGAPRSPAAGPGRRPSRRA